MLLASNVMLAQTQNIVHQPSYFFPVMAGLFLAGAVAWLIATVLGFARARAFGPSARWFTFSAICLLLFHIQFIVAGFGYLTNDNDLAINVLTFLNLFVVLGALCAIMGFIRLTSPR